MTKHLPQGGSGPLQSRGGWTEQIAQSPLTPEQFAALEKVLLIDVKEICRNFRWDLAAARLRSRDY